MDRIEIEDEAEFVQRFPFVHEQILREVAARSIELKDYQFAYCFLYDHECSITYYENETGDDSFYLEFDLKNDPSICTVVSINGE